MVEDAMRRCDNQYHGAGEGDEERRGAGSGNDADKAKLGASKERSTMEPYLSKASTSSMKDHHHQIKRLQSKIKLQGDDDDDQVIKSARAEMGEVREENQRLKTYLDRMMKDYKSLQIQFHRMIHQHQSNTSSTRTDHHATISTTVDHDHNNITQTTTNCEEHPHLAVSLSLGASSSEPAERDIGKETTKTSWGKIEEGLSLGLDCKFEATTKSDAYDQSQLTSNASPTTVNSIDEEEQTIKEEAAVETWPPSKVLKTARAAAVADDEVLQQNPTRKARVSVRARCDTPTMNDGCQWRKYGQKISKGNPCPRAYYRCTFAPSCPVRKQVQRCSDDMSILITTYEGAHNHPLPMSATAMASTTSAAASMLLSGSSSSSASRPSLGPSLTSTSTAAAANLHGINYYLSSSNHYTSKSSSNQFYLHSSSFLSSSTSTHPTITLDLTTSTPSSSFHLFNSSFPKYSSNNSTTSLNFSSSASILNWGDNNGFLSYGSSGPSKTYNMNNHNSMILGSLNNLGSTTRPVVLPNNHIPQSYMQQNNHVSVPAAPDTIAAATKAVTADPSFQSAVAIALTSIINGNGSSNGNNNGGMSSTTGGDHIVQNLKWSATHEQYFPLAGTATSNSNNACAPRNLNKTTSAADNSHQPGSNLMFLPSYSLPISPPRSASASPDDRGHAST